MVRPTALASRWLLLALLLIAVILVPFWIFGERLSGAAGELLDTRSGRALAAAAIVSLLSADVLLPIPSSVVLAASGTLLGTLPGLAASWVGLQCGALLGYAIGRFGGTEVAARLVGAAEMARAARGWERWGGPLLVGSRAVPVLAESAVLLAGIAAMPAARFAALTGCANLGIAAVYAAAGARVEGPGGFLVVFAASLVIPGALMLAARITLPRRARTHGEALSPGRGPHPRAR